MGEKYYLGFNSEALLEEYLIDEPGNADTADYNLKQEDKKFRRDLLFSGGEIELVFWARRRHMLRKLLYYRSKFGWESKVYLRIVDGADELKLDLDFKNSSTDGIRFFKFKLIQSANVQIIKRRRDVKVDCLSALDCDKRPITPLVPSKFLLKAKPIVQKSRWETNPVVTDFANYGNDGAILPMFTTLKELGIGDSFAPYSPLYVDGLTNDPEASVMAFSQGNLEQIRDEITLIRATANLSDITVKIKGVNLLVDTHGFYVNTQIRLNYGTDYSTGQYTSVILYQSSASVVSIINQDFTATIPQIPNLGFMWLQISVTQPYTTGGGTPVSNTHLEYSAASLDIELTSTAYNSVTYGLRLYDVMKYVIKSISGLDIVCPRFEPGGEFHDQFLVSGKFLRNIIDKGFFITLKQIEDIIEEWLGDFETQPDDKVFFGIFEDYYTNDEIAVFTDVQFDKFEKKFNPRFEINRFSFGYKTYQSQKENTVENTSDEVHGESEWLNNNQNVENIREISLEAARSAPYIEQLRLAAFKETATTSTQDDDKLVIIDVNTAAVIDAEEITFNETANVFFTLRSDNYISVKNDSSFSWVILGLTPGSNIVILSPATNAGYFSVISVTAQEIVIIGGGDIGDFHWGQTVINFTYGIDATQLVGVNWTNEGFTSIENIANGQNYANLRFTLKWDIFKYHLRYLASTTLFAALKIFANTFYKNNPEAVTVYNGQTIVEGEDFTPINPILSGDQFENLVYITTFSKFMQLQMAIRTRRGFIRAIDTEGFVFRFYPKSLGYEKFKKALTIKEGEEKYHPTMIDIVQISAFQISVNDEYHVSRLKWEPVGEHEIRLLDNENRALYNPMFWHKISFNGVIASSNNELKLWLLSLS